VPGKWEKRVREKNKEAAAKKVFIESSKNAKVPQRRSIAPAKKKKDGKEMAGKGRGRKKAEEEMGKDNRPLGQGKNREKLLLVVVGKHCSTKCMAECLQ